MNLLFFSLLVSLLWGAADEGSLEIRLGRVLERELAGELAGALADYRGLLDEAAGTNAAVAGKILYRIGLCEQRLGQAADARRTWRKLVETYPPADPQVVRARDALRSIERELDRIVVEGEVRGGNCILLTGEWGNEPAVLVGSNGAFRVERQVAGQFKDGRRYCYLFAEHPTLPLVAAGVSVQCPVSSVQRATITLKPAIDLAGRVVDDKGEAVTGALIRVVGYWTAESSSEEIPLPFDNILPPVYSGTNGEFRVQGLPPGVRYVWTAGEAGRSVQLPAVPAGLTWLRGDPESGGALSEESLRGRVVVYHYGSAYVESSVRALYPGEPGLLSQLAKLYGEQGLVVIWVLPEDEGKGEAARMALELYPDLSVAVGGPGTPVRGNVVVGREGTVHPPCPDQALFKSVKQALGY